MRPVQSPFGPGLVIIASSHLARFTKSEISLMSMMVPEKTDWVRAQGTTITFARNEALRDNLQDYHEWVWFIDDDHVFSDESLMRLLSRRVDVIQPLTAVKNPPFCSMAQRNDENGIPHTISWEKHVATDDLMECDAVGCGGMLIQRGVLNAMTHPWFRCGQLDPEQIQEDHYFCNEAKRLGFQVYCDLREIHGHMGTHAVRPSRSKDGQWRIGLELGNGLTVHIPCPSGVAK